MATPRHLRDGESRGHTDGSSTVPLRSSQVFSAGLQTTRNIDTQKGLQSDLFSLLDVLLAHLPSVPPRGKGPIAAATEKAVKLGGGGCRGEEEEEKRQRRRSCTGRLNITRSKDIKIVGLIYRLVGLEWLDCKRCRKSICQFRKSIRRFQKSLRWKLVGLLLITQTVLFDLGCINVLKNLKHLEELQPDSPFTAPFARPRCSGAMDGSRPLTSHPVPRPSPFPPEILPPAKAAAETERLEPGGSSCSGERCGVASGAQPVAQAPRGRPRSRAAAAGSWELRAWPQASSCGLLLGR